METLEIALLILAFLLSIAGIIGCFLPIIPGPPLSFLGLLTYNFISTSELTSNTLIIWFFVSLAVTVLDLIIPVWGAKRFGGSSYGIYGSGIGLVAGLFFFPPIGLIVGPFIGAYIGELLHGKTGKEALRASLGSFIGFLTGTFVKLIACFAMLYLIIADLV